MGGGEEEEKEVVIVISTKKVLYGNDVKRNKKNGQGSTIRSDGVRTIRKRIARSDKMVR